jgi:hypothetical protein
LRGTKGPGPDLQLRALDFIYFMEGLWCSLLRQPYPLQQVYEARIGAKVVESRIDLNEENSRTNGKRLI